MEAQRLSPTTERDSIQEKFNMLTEMAKREYPDLDQTISTYATTMAETTQFFEFNQFVSEQPREISTNQFTLA